MIARFMLCLLALVATAQTSRRSITDTDIYAFHWLADAQVSPDGARIVYTQITVAPKHDNYDTALWIVDTAGGPPRQLSAGLRDSSPRWSPDGRSIAFLRGTPPQIWLLPMDGGEAHAITDIPKGAGEFEWAPDGLSIAFSSTTLPKDFDAKKPDAPEDTDIHIITSAIYRNNGSGFRDSERPAHIWLAGLSVKDKPRQLTSGEFAESGIAWSRDSARIFFTSDRVKDPEFLPPDSNVYAVPAAGGPISEIASIDGPIELISPSPDGKRIAFVGALNRGDSRTPRSYSQTDLFIADLAAGATPKNLTTAYDFDIAGGPSGDQAPPRGARPSAPWWGPDGRAIFTATGEQGKGNLKRIDTKTGQVTPLTDDNAAIYSYSASADGTKIAALITTPTSVGDLFLIDAKSGQKRQVTHSNESLFANLNLTRPEMIWYKSFDGRQIQAWVQRPPDFKEGTKYPLILDIHGGPHAAYGYTFDHEFQWMAAKGYVVLYPNPRGSTTYGQEFGNVIQYRYPGDDYKDLMAGVDELIHRGWIDPERLGVTGGSGGGVLTNWIVGHTTRFKAAVSQRSIADWAGWWYTADMIAPSWFRGAPWEFEADFKERSPITYVRNIETPLLLIEGDSDLRTPPADGGEQMFRALKYLKKPVAMVRFPGESHELSRSGKPTHRVERLDQIVGWFDKYLTR